jgi:hypothetical protein
MEGLTSPKAAGGMEDHVQHRRLDADKGQATHEKSDKPDGSA